MQPVIKKICNLINAESLELQLAAIRVLAELQVRDPQVVQLIGQRIKKASSPQLRVALLEIVAKTPVTAYLPHLIDALQSSEMQRDRIVSIMTQMGPGAVPYLRKAYKKVTYQTKQAILDVFARLKSREAIDFLLMALLDQSNFEHLRYVCSLLRPILAQAERKNRSWLRTRIVRFVNRTDVKKNASVLTSGIILMGYLGDVSFKKNLLKFIATNRELGVRKFALISLSLLPLEKKGNEDVIKALFPLLHHDDFSNIVKNAIATLEKQTLPEKYKKQLTKLLESHHPSVRSFALSKLGTYDSKENVSTLTRYLDSNDFRIRDAAKSSLEKMSRAVPALLIQFDHASGPEKASQIIHILQSHKIYFKKRAACQSIVKRAEKLVKQNNEQYKRYFALLKAVNPDYLYTYVMTSVKAFQRKKKWDQALFYLNQIEGSVLFNEEARFAYMVNLLKRSKQDLSSAYRDQDKGLLMLQSMVKSAGASFAKRIQKEKAFDPKDKYYIGFHFSEKLFDLREFGIQVLKQLAKGNTTLGRLAKKKLSIVGSLSAAAV
ncbi:MAG: hypothetical protein COV74_01680 [Candidatus Omnitrophica bacterium CG11_big_fil_rev_8_21_14_0_20_45_26]|uniref:Clathrin/coatomer adaptor adaptin-like N-terminal domain-containing protein n=1 Tax=Candidatus Abzuiibacterium crystallinum TaxID=1974748 RepID=A0A2H0LSC7_9BACT|nr:MAG: hypothetical protein COV74_01680 [Candidatus Omnitrophica bacterium CG11_big_fil_rev_8_21_14_0_20_45_26]PIW65006.1 MAG: hypothetical protein COW12_03960 [Candidatus Omnitrophica bacterium CG12_big_fil_rev_8_21_14_0_65_45_16]